MKTKAIRSQPPHQSPFPPPVKAGNYILRLFVAGATARSRQAVLHVRQTCAAELKAGCQLEVIDIYQQPQMAQDHQILATPTLIKTYPRPVRRFIGNLLNLAGLFAEAKPELAAKPVL